MGKFSFDIDDSFLKQLGKLGDIEPHEVKMVDAGLEVMKKNLINKLSSHRVTGELLDSVTASKAKKLSDGKVGGKIYFDGYESGSYKSKKYPKGKPNAIKAIAIEFGTSNQTAKPFRDAVLNESGDEILDAMQKVFNEATK